MMKKVFLIGSLCLIGLSAHIGIFWWAQTDDPLSPQAQAILKNIPEVPEKSDAYLYMMGMVAHPDDDPMDAGRAVHESIVAGIEQFRQPHGEFDYQPYPKDRELALPEGPLFCELNEPGCIRRLLEDHQGRVDILSRHELLARRYHRFTALRDYRTLSAPMLLEPIPPFQYLTRGHRLALLQAVTMAREGKVDQALAAIHRDLSHLQAQLRMQDMLIGKMVVAALIDDSLDLAMVLARQHDARYPSDIPRLGPETRDMTQPFAREFTGMHAMMDKLDRAPDIFSEDGEVPGWFVRILFKPHMTTNAMAPFYSRLIEYSRLPTAALITRLQNDEPIAIPTNTWRNAIGDILNGIAMPDLKRYVLRLHDLEAQIGLFNTLVNAPDIEEAIVAFDHPYGAPSRSQDGIAVCFSGPESSEKGSKCLRVALRAAETMEPSCQGEDKVACNAGL